MIAPIESIVRRLARVGARPQEVEERFIRGSGPGGQKINKTSSTVWLRHGPTGIEVRCQAERSQSANRELAWRELCARLEERAAQAAAEARAEKEAQRRRGRQKSRGQKQAMVRGKRFQAQRKAGRRQRWGDSD
jgi:protein subunit release factor B